MADLIQFDDEGRKELSTGTVVVGTESFGPDREQKVFTITLTTANPEEYVMLFLDCQETADLLASLRRAQETDEPTGG